ncbi:hypothetical protein DID76_02505 [Candidatus Marinamargulisbacteria bacterium SCGC AG-414-C22]|nr:hypothetical protein DID76_02505 [Candidatus Marinamargulisbacteria bacterium SCGC AG-414-C22]
MTTSFTHITIIGLGLMGGSLAKRIKKHHPTITLIGIDTNSNTLQLAKKDSTFNNVYPNILNAPQKTDLIFICTPLKNTLTTIKACSDHFNDNCIITDIGSTKKDITNNCPPLKPHQAFFPGHPMAGKEVTGFTASDHAIFNNTSYILIPINHPKYLPFKTFIQSLSVTVIETDQETHDQMIALASHFPYIVTTLLINLVKSLPKEKQTLFKTILGPGFKDTTRIAASSPEWGCEVTKNNSVNVNELLDLFLEHITDFKELLNHKTDEHLMTFFKDMKKIKDILNQ